MWCQTDKKWSEEHFLRSTGLNTIIDSPEFDVGVVSAIIGDDLIQLFSKESYTSVRVHTNGRYYWSHWSGPVLHSKKQKIFRTVNLMGQARKDSVRDYWSGSPVHSTMSRNWYEAIWPASHFSDNSQEMHDLGRLSSCSWCMNTSCRNSSSLHPKRRIFIRWNHDPMEELLDM